MTPSPQELLKRVHTYLENIAKRETLEEATRDARLAAKMIKEAGYEA